MLVIVWQALLVVSISISLLICFLCSCTSSGATMPQLQRFVWIIEKKNVCVYFHIIANESACSDHAAQVQQSVLLASEQLPCLSEAVGGSQEDERHRLGRKNPGAGEKAFFILWFCCNTAPRLFYSHTKDDFLFFFLNPISGLWGCKSVLPSPLPKTGNTAILL